MYDYLLGGFYISLSLSLSVFILSSFYNKPKSTNIITFLARERCSVYSDYTYL